MSEQWDELCFLSIQEASERIKRCELSPVELTRAYLHRIEAVDPQLRAYRNVLADAALREARAAEAEVLAGNYKGPLHGIPVAHKEQYDVKGLPSLARSRGASAPAPAPMPTEDATSVRRVREAGSVLLGKLVMPGIASGPHDGPPRNPWNLSHITGGSSSGSGAAVAAGLCMGSLGEDSAGSIRKPSSLCGIVGVKPTFGRASRTGLAPLGWSVDDCGPMTRSVEDAALMLQAIAGYDARDLASVRVPVPDFSAAIHDGIRGFTVAVPRHFIQEHNFGIDGAGIDAETLAAFDRALAQLESLGARIREVKIPSLPAATIANTAIQYTERFVVREKEALSHLEEFEETRRLEFYIGALTTGADYVQAQRVRSRVQREVAAVLNEADVLALPAQPTPAPSFEDHDPFSTVLIQIDQNLLTPFNLIGLPAMSVPSGFSKKRLPIGLQVVGKPFDEATMLRVAYAYEQQARWFEKRPPI